eukprot:gene23347-30598_t
MSRNDMDTGGDRTTGNLAWISMLQHHLRSTPSSPSTPEERKQLADAILENPNSAESWALFLQNEEAVQSEYAKDHPTCPIDLFPFFHRATELVQRSRGSTALESYISVWLGYVRHQWRRSEEDGRDTLKTLKNQQIVVGEYGALLYQEWARLEMSSGNICKAVSVVQKGLKENAQPESLLRDLKAELQALSDGCNFTDQVTLPSLQAEALTQYPPCTEDRPPGTANRPHTTTLSNQGAGLIPSTPTVDAASFHTAQQQHSLAGSTHASRQRPLTSTLAAHPTTAGGCNLTSTPKTQSTANFKYPLSAAPRSVLSGGVRDMTIMSMNRSTVSGSSGSEEETITCGRPSSASDDVTIRSLASNSSGHTDGIAGNTPSTATLQAMHGSGGVPAQPQDTTSNDLVAPTGIKRFGFKSKALRVGGTAAPPVEKQRLVLAGGGAATAIGQGGFAPSPAPPHSALQTSNMDRRANIGAAMADLHLQNTALGGASAASTQQGAGGGGSISRHSADVGGDVKRRVPIVDSRAALGHTLAQPAATAPAIRAPNAGAHCEVACSGGQYKAAGSTGQYPGQVSATGSGSTRITGYAVSDENMAPRDENSAPQPGLKPPSSKTVLSEAVAPQARQPNGAQALGVAPPDAPAPNREPLRPVSLSQSEQVLGCNRQIYGLKRVRLQNKDPEAIKGFIDEIALLKQLRNTPNIIQLIDAQVFREEGLIYMVLEYGDIDLARLLHNHEESRKSRAEGASGAGPDSGSMDENFVRLYWQQMLQAVQGIHEMRIVHSDLKPANFMLVQGQLRLIDFGIAKSIAGDTISISRDDQIYREN